MYIILCSSLAIMIVFALPPRLSFRSHVRAESRYGTNIRLGLGSPPLMLILPSVFGGDVVGLSHDSMSDRRAETTVLVKLKSVNILTLWTPNYFLQNSCRHQINFSMLLLGAELIFAKLPPGAGLFFKSEKRRDPLQAFMPVTK